MTCSSDEALQWYNNSLTAFATLRESPLPLVTKASELDPSMPLAHCLTVSPECRSNEKYGWLARLDPTLPYLAPHIEAVKSVDTTTLTERERSHVRAFITYASGNLPQATEEWVSILVNYPFDLFAISALHRACVWLGEFQKQCDTMARVLPHWKEDMALYPFIISMYAYSLEENNQRDKAEELVRKALSMETKLPWAYHALSHVIEEERDPAEGVEFLTSTRKEWSDCVQGVHIAWHLSLYHLDLSKTDDALQVYDSMVTKGVTGGSMFALIDAASFLWRLNLMGVDPGEGRWEKVTDSCIKWMENHGSAWFDAHIMMSLAHGKVSESAARMALARQMVQSMAADASTNAFNTGTGVTEKLGVPVCNALLAFGQENEEVLSLILPLRYDLVRFGGSWAQRQVFTVTVIEAAVRAKQVPLALALAAELKAQKPKSKHLSRLFEELKSSYDRQQRSLPPMDVTGQPAAKRTRGE